MIRISKPPVNIREKLAELERPIGLNGSALMRTETPQEAFSLIGAGRKNLLINGDMRIAQRATSTNSAASNTYIVDRWQYEASTTGVVNVEQSSDAPDGFKYSSKITITTPDTSIASTDFQQIFYKMEANDISHLNYGTSSAKTCTLSFWVKSSKTGIFPFSFQNHIGTRVYPENYTVNQANTWEYKTIVFPGDTGGSWATTGTSIGLRFTFQFMLGSNFTGGTRGAWAATTGYQNLCPPYTANLQETNATFQITGLQLEVGKVATPFEYRSYGEELALCQRYFQILMNGQYKDPWVGVIRNSLGTTSISTPIKFNSLMRSAPSISAPTVTNLRVNGRYGDTALTGGSVVMNDINERGTILIVLSPTASGWTFNLGEGVYINCETTASNILTASSEL